MSIIHDRSIVANNIIHQSMIDRFLIGITLCGFVVVVVVVNFIRWLCTLDFKNRPTMDFRRRRKIVAADDVKGGGYYEVLSTQDPVLENVFDEDKGEFDGDFFDEYDKEKMQLEPDAND